MSYSSSGFTGIHVLQEGIFYWMIHFTRGHLLNEDLKIVVCGSC